ncbi:MAG TPA: translocation/assembly module TamB domain-containing protein [Vicinamibacterales bacterium]|nr:translocation/assembly module TamB domain-containing protein [Vicinamibacterales bacterium]
MKRRVAKIVVRVVVALALVLCLVVAITLKIDLGPSLRGRAEREAANFLKRPVKIGRLSARLIPGRFVVEDFVIAGLEPRDRPFLTANRIEVAMPWWTAFRNQIVFDGIRMTGWKMVVETFPNGRHNFPRFTRERQTTGPKRFTTTLRYVSAENGEFIYDDHSTPWQTIARNLNVMVSRWGDTYRGHARFSDGVIAIQSYVPMSADMTSSFRLDGGRVHFDRIDLRTDGARSVVTGDVNLARWPEQQYQVSSRIQLPRMRELFFARDAFTLSGEAAFEGTFHLFKGGRELRGRFSSPVAGVNAYRFPNLRGTVVWLPDSLDVPEATAGVFDGQSQFTYRMWKPERRGRWLARFDARYQDVDLARFTDFVETRGLRLAGRADGRSLLEWPLGRFSAELRGGGTVNVSPPVGVALQGRELEAAQIAAADARGVDTGPFNPGLAVGYVPIGGRVTYALTPERITLDDSWIATRSTHASFSGSTAWLDAAEIPFHVTSSDWQDSDRLMAAILTTFGSPTSAVQMGGYGTFDGVMRKSFRRPRIEGQFTGGALTAWNTVWGQGEAHVVVENSYVEVRRAVLARMTGETPSEIRVDGTFSLGYPRRDGGEEINAHVVMKDRPLADLRQAFELFDYPVDGLTSGEFRLQGRYAGPTGFGTLRIDRGVAYEEPFERATAGLRFEGTGVRLDSIEIQKGSGAATGAAWVGWDGTYSFNVDGRRIPVESLKNVAFPRAPLSGLLQLTAAGNGTFESPRYEVRFSVADLYAGEEGIGHVTGRIGIRGDLLAIEQLEAASPRLTLSGSGQIELTDEMDAALTFRFSDTSLDPYVRTFVPKLSPFTTAVVSGTIDVRGELYVPEHLRIDLNVEQLEAKLFDYRLRAGGPLRLAVNQQRIIAKDLRLVGEGTQLEVNGEVNLLQERVALTATGSANLGILQGFFRNVRSSGAASLSADVRGSLNAPEFAGFARVSNGRIRHFALPHSLDAINGTMSFDARGVRLDDLTARMGGGLVRFGGRVGLDGFKPGTLSLTAIGEGMRLRYPEGFTSVVDADLSLVGTVSSPLVEGTVMVRSSMFARRLDTAAAIFGLGAVGGGGVRPAEPAPVAGLPLRFNLHVTAPSSLRVNNNAMDLTASADLRLTGTYDRPVLLGRADIERGWLTFEGNRYVVTRGGINFANPSRIEPFFDVEAETRVQVPGQTYRVTLSAAGTLDAMTWAATADPPLPTAQVLALLLGEGADPDADLRRLQEGQGAERELFTALAARGLATPLSNPLGRVFEETLGVTTQITPIIGEFSTLQTLNPTARVIIGRRLSSRVYVTYSQALGSGRNEQIVLIEYDQSDRLGWILSRNEDGTFALEFRVRHTY